MSSTLLKRILIAVFFIPIFIFLFFTKLNFLFYSFFLLVLILMTIELTKILNQTNINLELPFIISGTIIIYLSFVFCKKFSVFALIGIIFIYFCFLIIKNELSFINYKKMLGFTLIMIYPVFLFSHLVLIKKLSHSGYYLLFLFCTLWANDTMAYAGGHLIGKKMGLRASPNKTWGGTIVGFIFAVITGIILDMVFKIFNSLWCSLTIGGILGIIGFFGDLIESIFKRSAGIKDSSKILPGHGGVLDRFDNFIFAIPIYYYILLIVK